MGRHSDLSLRGHAHRLVRFLEALDLEDVTLAFNDWCAAQIIVADGATSRVGRLVFVSCETDDNYPPGLPGRILALSGGLPGGLFLPAKMFGFRWARRLPFTFGRMSSQPIPDAVMDGWLDPARRSAAIRRDLQRYAGDTRRGKRDLLEATRKLHQFEKPVLVAWGRDDRVMPLSSGRRLAASFAHSTFVEIPGAGALVPWDQPDALASAIAHFANAAAPENHDV
jgi:pimeloyl-ACP methyl ester carboxylesterase